MTGHFGKGFLLACAASCIACGSEDGVGPVSAPTPEAPVFTVLELSPPAVWINQGSPGLAGDVDRVQLFVTARSQSGERMWIPTVVSYASSAPEIATVSATGLVTGIAPGNASISASATIGSSTRTAVISASVLQLDSNEVVLTSGSRGWQPSEVHLNTGAIVHWQSGPINWTGVSNTKLWLMDAGYSVVDSADLSSGSATRKFDNPGTIRYCSGGCWDPPDFGIIYVR